MVPLIVGYACFMGKLKFLRRKFSLKTGNFDLLNIRRASFCANTTQVYVESNSKFWVKCHWDAHTPPSALMHAYCVLSPMIFVMCWLIVIAARFKCLHIVRTSKNHIIMMRECSHLCRTHNNQYSVTENGLMKSVCVCVCTLAWPLNTLIRPT